MSKSLLEALSIFYPDWIKPGVVRIEIGPGWYDIIVRLMRNLTDYSSFYKLVPLDICQIKEKFGGLRFYYDPVDGWDEADMHVIDYFIDRAEAESIKTCENCGVTESVTTGGEGWIKTYCPKCREVLKEY